MTTRYALPKRLKDNDVLCRSKETSSEAFEMMRVKCILRQIACLEKGNMKIHLLCSSGDRWRRAGAWNETRDSCYGWISRRCTWSILEISSIIWPASPYQTWVLKQFQMNICTLFASLLRVQSIQGDRALACVSPGLYIRASLAKCVGFKGSGIMHGV